MELSVLKKMLIGGAKKIIAINTDPKAPIFAVADYKIVGDCVTVLENILKAMED